MDVLNDIKRTETGKRGELRPIVNAPEVLKKKAIVEFTATCVAIPGFVGQFTVVVKRFGKEDFTVFCKVDSYDGTAKKNVAYMPISKEFVFEPYVVEQKILVTVIGDKHKNIDSNFFLKLTLPKENNEPRVSLGAMSIMEVVVMDIEREFFPCNLKIKTNEVQFLFSELNFKCRAWRSAIREKGANRER